MPRLDVRPDYQLLVRLLRDPGGFGSLSHHDLSRAIDVADDTRLLGWLLAEVDARELANGAPDWLADRIETVRTHVGEYERSLRWEIDRLRRAFHGVSVPWVLLKGAGYVAAALPPGRGRRVADIDVLVPFESLEEAERLLNEHGWRTGVLDPYDERYYREWMHELPPMVHQDRRSIVDLHHAILPRTSRLAPATPRLMDRAVPVGGVRVLCPAHMVLHAAAHLFHDGEISGAIRDVVDLDGLVRTFARDPRFWPDLLVEARELGLVRPAYYALRYATRLLGTPIPDEVRREMRAWSPPAPIGPLMDALVERALPGSSSTGARAAVFALYLRSHWLRMPAGMLIRHLTHQMLRRDRKT